MITILQDEYKLLQEGKLGNDSFIKKARQLHPKLIHNSANIEETIQILGRKSIITEGYVDLQPINKWESTPKESYEIAYAKYLAEAKEKESKPAKAEEKSTTKEVEDSQDKGSLNKDPKSFDNLNNEEILRGLKAEKDDPKNAKKDQTQLINMVLKNLSSDPLYYVKNAAFGVKGIGYELSSPQMEAGKNDQMEEVKLAGSITTEKANTKDNKQGPHKAGKIKTMAVNPKSQRGIKKMKSPGKEKKVSIKENFEIPENNLEDIKLQAAMISKDEGIVVHINQLEGGEYKMEDWFDADRTVASYGNGDLLEDEKPTSKYSDLYEDEEDINDGGNFEFYKESIERLVDIGNEFGSQNSSEVSSLEDELIRAGLMKYDSNKEMNVFIGNALAHAGRYDRSSDSRGINEDPDPDEEDIMRNENKNKEIMNESKDPYKIFKNFLLTEAKKPAKLIREGKKNKVSKKLSEIEKLGVSAALEAKMTALDEEIETCNSKLRTIDESDLAELIDKKQIKELQKDIKLLEKQKAKYDKLYEKATGSKKKEVIDESQKDTSTEDMIDYILNSDGSYSIEDLEDLEDDKLTTIYNGLYFDEDEVNEASSEDVETQKDLTAAIKDTTKASSEFEKSSLEETEQPSEEKLSAMKTELEGYVEMVGNFGEAVQMYLHSHPEDKQHEVTLRQLAEPLF